jgi:hypothetical protein
LSFFNWQFVFQFHHSILSWLGIRLHGFFSFAFYEIILISWLKSHVKQVYSSFFFIFFNWYFFTISSFSICFFFFLWIKLHDLFWFVLYEIISVLWFESRVMRLNQSKLRSFYCVMFLDWGFLIPLGWWILFWSLKYFHIFHVILNVCPFITSIKIICNKIKA